MRNVVAIIMLLWYGACDAQNMLSEFIQDALKETITVIEQKDLSTRRFIGRDSLDERYHNLLPVPHRFFIDGYSYRVSLVGRIGFDAKPICFTNKIRRDIESNFKNVRFTFDSIALECWRNNVKLNGFFKDYGEKAMPKSLFEILDISDVKLRGDKMTVTIGYTIMDDNGIVVRSPIEFDHTHVITKNGEWVRYGSILYRNENVTHFPTKEDFKMIREEWDEFDELSCMVPYAYTKLYRFMTGCALIADARRSLNILLDENRSRYIKIPDELVPEDEHYWFADSIMYEGVNLTPYRDAEFLSKYSVSEDAECESCASGMSVGSEDGYRFVAGPSDVVLEKDLIRISIDLYEVVAVSGSDKGSDRLRDCDRMLLAPIITYRCDFRYNKRQNRWRFVNDNITKATGPKICIKKSGERLLVL